MSKPDDEAGGGPNNDADYSQDEFDKSVDQAASQSGSQKQQQLNDAGAEIQ